MKPINVVIFHDSTKINLKVSFPLRCFQRLSRTNVATLRCFWKTTDRQGIDTSRSLRTRVISFQFFAPTVDRDQTVSRRSKPISCSILIGEQPNPWELLHPQDMLKRHRGAKHPHRYGLLKGISLLSPAYLLFVERWSFHKGPPDHYDRLFKIVLKNLCSECLPYS